MGIIKEEGDRLFFITENISHLLQAYLSWVRLCILSNDHQAVPLIT